MKGSIAFIIACFVILIVACLFIRMYQQEVVEYFEGTDHYLMENENKSYSLRFRSFDADIMFKVSRSTSVNADYSTYANTQTNIVQQFDPFNMVLRIVNKFYLIDSRNLQISSFRKIVFQQKSLSTTPLSMTEEDEVAAVLAKYRITAIRKTTPATPAPAPAPPTTNPTAPPASNITCDFKDNTRCIFKNYVKKSDRSCDSGNGFPYTEGLASTTNQQFKDWLKTLYDRNGGGTEREAVTDYINRCKGVAGYEFVKDAVPALVTATPAPTAMTLDQCKTRLDNIKTQASYV